MWLEGSLSDFALDASGTPADSSVNSIVGEASSDGGTEDCAAVAGIFSSGWEDVSPDEIIAPQYAQGLVVSFTEWSHFGQFIIFSSIFNYFAFFN